MSVLKPYQRIETLIEMLERDEVQYREAVKPMHDVVTRINNRDLIPFYVEFGGYSGSLSFYQSKLEEINEQLKGTKLQRIIRILKEK